MISKCQQSSQLASHLFLNVTCFKKRSFPSYRFLEFTLVRLKTVLKSGLTLFCKQKAETKRAEREKENTCLAYCSKQSISIPLSFGQTAQIQRDMHETLFISKVIQTQRGPCVFQCIRKRGKLNDE